MSLHHRTFARESSRRYHLNYIRCSDMELHQLIRNRKIHANIRDRRQAIPALQAADDTATFRFLDLPPELRILVYQNLLTCKPVGHRPFRANNRLRCFPEILSTSKQVYGEAGKYLYSGNVLVVTFAAETVDMLHAYRLTCDVCGMTPKAWDTISRMGTNVSLQRQSIDWPCCLRLAEKLTIEINSIPVSSRSTFGQPAHGMIANATVLNRSLYDLACFLLAQSKVKEITFDISGDEQNIVDDDKLADILSPIRLFPAEKSFKLRGLASPVCDSIQTPISTSVQTTGSHSVVDILRSLVQETDLVVGLCATSAVRTKINLREIQEYRAEGVEALGVRGLITPHTHFQLLDTVRRLRMELSCRRARVYRGYDPAVLTKLAQLAELTATRRKLQF